MLLVDMARSVLVFVQRQRKDKDKYSLEGCEGGGGHGKVGVCIGTIAKTAEKAVSELASHLISIIW